MAAYQNEEQIIRDALSAELGDLYAFTRLLVALTNDPTAEYRSLVAFELMDRAPEWTIPQLISIQAAVVAVASRESKLGVHIRVLKLLTIIITVEMHERIGGSAPHN